MRDTFIDIDTSRPFNGDPPYIFRFEEGQSIGLNYIKKICMVSDSPSITIRTEPDQTIFRVLKMDQDVPNTMEIIKMNLKAYADLNSLIAENNEWTCTGVPYALDYEPISEDQTVSGPQDLTPASSVYVYMFYILGKSEEPGEYTGDIWINDRKYFISADFYAENEVLKENLKNFESRLPESIQKAIYESDVHEELNDNILINRKNKELLMQYMSIMGNKGSYESLLNSINWFEWGELLKMEELWKRYINDNLDYDYFAEELNHMMSPEDIKQLADHVKSTFLGIYCALNKIQVVNNRTAYQDSFGRMNIQSGTSWQDMDASHMYAPDGIYNSYDNIGVANINPGDNSSQGAAAAEIGTEEIMSDSEFSDYHPGTMTETSNIAPGVMAAVQGSGGQVSWVEITSGMIDTHTYPIGSNVSYWEIDYNYIYNEQMPNLLRVCAMWSAQDLSLKMTVLGNFFSSFFLPIHLDLIHSCIEYWTFSYALKQIYTQSVDQKSFVSCISGIDLVLDSDFKISPHPETMSFVDTILRNYNTEDVFGFSTDSSRHEEILAELDGSQRVAYNVDVLKYMYKGECCPVRFIGKIYTGVDEDISIYKQRLVWYRGNGEFIKDDIPSYYNLHFYKDPITGEYYEITDYNRQYLLLYTNNPSDPAGIPNDGFTYSDLIKDEVSSYHEYHFYKDPDTGGYYEINDTNRQYLLLYINDPDDPDGIPNDGFTYSGNRGGIESCVAIYPDEEYVYDSIPVYETGHYYKAGDSWEEITNENKDFLEKSFTPTYSKKMVFNLDFSVGFKKEGEYIVYLEFYDTCNRIYSKKVKFNISDMMYNRIEVMKMVPADIDEWSDVTPPIDLYQYADVDKLPENFTDDDILLQSHFFCANSDGDPYKAGLNHTIAAIVEDGYEFDGDEDFDPELNVTIWSDGQGSVEGNRAGSPFESGRLDDLVADLEEAFPDYWWSWDRIQISKRDNIIVKPDDINPWPKE